MSQFKLVVPSAAYLQSFADACVEMKNAGIMRDGFPDPELFDHRWPTLLQDYEKQRNGISLPPGYVPASTFWLVKDSRFFAMANLRHHLTPALEKYGGHIGYAVRVCEWNKGYGTLLLSLVLEKASAMGIESALITCDEGNLASAKVIENNGGQYQDTVLNQIDGKLIHTKRYWVKTDRR